MLNSKDDIKILYLFKFENKSLVELKKLNTPKNTPLNEIYSWVWIDHQEGRFLTLSFESLDSQNGFEIRYFKEGTLKFNDEKVEFRIGGVDFLVSNTL